MNGPKGNSEFCFPGTLNVPLGFARGTLRVSGKQNSLFPVGPVIKCFAIPPNSKVEQIIHVCHPYEFIAKCYKSQMQNYEKSKVSKMLKPSVKYRKYSIL